MRITKVSVEEFAELYARLFEPEFTVEKLTRLIIEWRANYDLGFLGSLPKGMAVASEPQIEHVPTAPSSDVGKRERWVWSRCYFGKDDCYFVTTRWGDLVGTFIGTYDTNSFCEREQ